MPTPRYRALLTKRNPLFDRLVSYWTLNEASDGSGATQRIDSFGANHLTDNNTTASAAGVAGNGADFEFTNSECLYVANNASLQMGSTSFTIACWIKPESYAAAINMVLSKYNNSDNHREYGIYLDVTGAPFFIVSADGTATQVSPIVPSCKAGYWALLIASYDTADQKPRLSVDGEADGVGTVTSAVFASDSPFVIGGRGKVGGFSAYFDGIVDEVMVWKRLLTASEKAALEIFITGGATTYASTIGV
jgi:hypothetical protein